MNRIECKSIIKVLEELSGDMVSMEDVYIVDRKIKEIQHILQHLESRDPVQKEPCKW